MVAIAFEGKGESPAGEGVALGPRCQGRLVEPALMDNEGLFRQGDGVEGLDLVAEVAAGEFLQFLRSG